MAFSNSFHSSAKSHSIGSASALADAEAHNERDFFSTRYSAKKTTLIVGELGLAENVKQFINEKFQPHVDAYNEKQRRRDRKIEESAFERFCNNKKLDVAVQAVFQVGDKDFWERWRTDEHIQRRGKETVRHSYPPEVVEVMDAVYRRQMDAYERIYETHAKEILAKIEWHYNRCQDTLDTFRATPERYEQFERLAEMKPKDRKKELENLSEDELDAYDEFQEAYHSAKDIEKRQYRERIKGGMMRIKMIQGIGHYDEWSPHAHGISVCWTDGYRNGLQSRVAKATVLNRYALEVIQDRMHEIAEEEIAKHPEIFGDEKLKVKEKGHHVNFSTEEFIRNKQRELIEKTDALVLQRSRLTGEVGLMEIQRADIADSIKEATATASDLQQQNTALAAQIAAGREELEGVCKIKTMVERDHVASEVQTELDELQAAYNITDEFCCKAEEDIAYGAFNLLNLVKDFIFDWQHIGERIHALIKSISEKIRDIGIFELTQKVRPENQMAGVLQSKLDKAVDDAQKRSVASFVQRQAERELENVEM